MLYLLSLLMAFQTAAHAETFACNGGVTYGENRGQQGRVNFDIENFFGTITFDNGETAQVVESGSICGASLENLLCATRDLSSRGAQRKVSRCYAQAGDKTPVLSSGIVFSPNGANGRMECLSKEKRVLVEFNGCQAQ
jgi:hypothetical protein